jgi:GAF domain-containing protein
MAELTQRTDYDLLALQAKGMLEEEPWYTAAMSNLSALLMDTMEKLNWAGFYIMRDGRLVVGPFQGKPACIHIAVGKGVCGTAVAEDKLQLVPDVHQFPGHIACDSASESEIVVPIHHNGEIVAVLDIDSPIKERFDETDAEGLQKFVQIVEENISWE